MPTTYRYPNETIILWITLLLVTAVIAFTSVATFCLAGVFTLVILGYAYYANKTHHESLMQNAILIDQKSSPDLQQVKELCEKRIDPGKPHLYVVNSAERNAYTFGYVRTTYNCGLFFTT